MCYWHHYECFWMHLCCILNFELTRLNACTACLPHVDGSTENAKRYCLRQQLTSSLAHSTSIYHHKYIFFSNVHVVLDTT